MSVKHPNDWGAKTREEREAYCRKLDNVRLQVWTLHGQGFSFSQIGKALGFSKITAWRHYKRYFANINKETQDEMRRSCIDELRRIQSESNDPKVKIMALDRIMKLFNLEQQHIDITSGGESLVKIIKLKEDNL